MDYLEFIQQLFCIFWLFKTKQQELQHLLQFLNTLFGHMIQLVLEKMDQLTNQLSIYHNLEHYQTSIHSDQQMQLKMLNLGKLHLKMNAPTAFVCSRQRFKSFKDEKAFGKLQMVDIYLKKRKCKYYNYGIWIWINVSTSNCLWIRKEGIIANVVSVLVLIYFRARWVLYRKLLIKIQSLCSWSCSRFRVL